MPGEMGAWKLRANGDLIWFAYMAASDHDYANAVTIDQNGSVYVLGGTWSWDFPTFGVDDFTNYHHGGEEAFVAKLESVPGQTQAQPVWVRLVGGSNNERLYTARVNSSGAIVAGGVTNSLTLLSSMNITGAAQNTFGGGESDGFLMKITSAGNLNWMTYFGGNGADSVGRVVSDPANNIWVVGMTSSAQFGPFQTGFQPVKSGEEDAYVVKVNNDDGKAIWGTYIGSGGTDKGLGIDYEANSNSVYVSGRTNGADFPVRNAYDNTYNGGLWDAWLMKIGCDVRARLTPSVAAVGGEITSCSGSVSFDAGAYKSYLWSTGATGRSITFSEPGTYTVWANVIDEGGCTAYTDTLRLTINAGPPRPALAIRQGDRSLASPGGQVSACNGTPITLDAGEYQQYVWYSGASGRVLSLSEPGSYTCWARVTDANGCSVISDTIRLTIYPAPDRPTLQITRDPNDGTIATLTIEGFDESMSYLWQQLKNGRWSTIAGEDGMQIVRRRQDGSYRVIVSNENDCADTSDVYQLSGTGGVGTITTLQRLDILPQPAGSHCRVEAEFKRPTAIQIQLFDTQGRLVRSLPKQACVTRHSVSINLGDLPDGSFMLLLRTEDGETTRLIIHHR